MQGGKGLAARGTGVASKVPAGPLRGARPVARPPVWASDISFPLKVPKSSAEGLQASAHLEEEQVPLPAMKSVSSSLSHWGLRGTSVCYFAWRSSMQRISEATKRTPQTAVCRHMLHVSL